MATKDLCYQRLQKIGDNEIEHQYYLYDRDDNVVVIAEFTNSYGRAGIQSSVEACQESLDYWNGFDEDMRLAEVAKSQAALDEKVSLSNLLGQPDDTIVELDT